MSEGASCILIKCQHWEWGSGRDIISYIKFIMPYWSFYRWIGYFRICNCWRQIWWIQWTTIFDWWILDLEGIQNQYTHTWGRSWSQLSAFHDAFYHVIVCFYHAAYYWSCTRSNLLLTKWSQRRSFVDSLRNALNPLWTAGSGCSKQLLCLLVGYGTS